MDTFVKCIFEFFPVYTCFRRSASLYGNVEVCHFLGLSHAEVVSVVD